MPALKRIARIAAGYVAASIVAGVIALLSILVVHIGLVALSPRALAELIGPFAIASAIAGATALLPTLPVGIYAERHAKRDLAWYTRAGIGVSLLALVLYVVGLEIASRSISKATRGDFEFVLTLAACVMLAGVCSGATYWAIAGRHAGEPALAK
ncbi:MAG: hypothetical protein NW223_17085 [Hyphomicrobiaceae bacterium]|nr:hypothetical protein [Hyphomicrobiaceae bacterium]